MQYQETETHTHQILTNLDPTAWQLDIYEDFLSSSEYLDTFCEGCIGDHDTALLFLIDGVQIFEKKASDCWIYIWAILNLAPNSSTKQTLLNLEDSFQVPIHQRERCCP